MLIDTEIENDDDGGDEGGLEDGPDDGGLDDGFEYVMLVGGVEGATEEDDGGGAIAGCAESTLTFGEPLPLIIIPVIV